jgi:hypothetical protein
MNLIKNIEQFNINSVFFCDPIKNNIINNSQFIRITYSTSCFTLNGVYILVPISYSIIEKYYNKFKCNIDNNRFRDIINNICLIETNILKKHSINNKQPVYKITEQFKMGTIKIFSYAEPTNNSFSLKISGVWETDTEYGLTYQFITC